MREEIEALRNCLAKLANAEALASVRSIVAGWNGENRPDGPYERHPRKLGAQLPKSNCGAIYDLDEALQEVRRLLAFPSHDREAT